MGQTTHRFLRAELRPIPLMRWRCCHCGMKVGKTDVARQLEGLPCAPPRYY